MIGRSLLWLTVRSLNQYPLSLVFLRDRSSDLYYSPCTHNPCLMSNRVTLVTITRTLHDDTEISDSAPPNDFTSAQSNIQSCVSDTLSWMQSNKLKLSTENKRDEPSVRISSVGCESADIGGNTFPFQTPVTYLGVHLDQTLSMKQTRQQPLSH